MTELQAIVLCVLMIAAGYSVAALYYTDKYQRDLDDLLKRIGEHPSQQVKPGYIQIDLISLRSLYIAAVDNPNTTFKPEFEQRVLKGIKALEEEANG